MKKRLTAWLLVLALGCSLLATVAFAGEKAERRTEETAAAENQETADGETTDGETTEEEPEPPSLADRTRNLRPTRRRGRSSRAR